LSEPESSRSDLIVGRSPWTRHPPKTVARDPKRERRAIRRARSLNRHDLQTATPLAVHLPQRTTHQPRPRRPIPSAHHLNPGTERLRKSAGLQGTCGDKYAIPARQCPDFAGFLVLVGPAMGVSGPISPARSSARALTGPADDTKTRLGVEGLRAAARDCAVDGPGLGAGLTRGSVRPLPASVTSPPKHQP
jgi:hypothetical protein